MVTAEHAKKERVSYRIREGLLTSAQVGAAEADRSESTTLEWHSPHRPEGVGSGKERTMAETGDNTKDRSDDVMDIVQEIEQRHA
jgi:hypothetical protein